jgi:D-arabinose 1-dehydrogenase-like Zn-dependent alcohol dehydrogenase
MTMRHVTSWPSEAARTCVAVQIPTFMNATMSSLPQPGRTTNSGLPCSLLRSGGHCSCIGIMFGDPSIPLFQMYMRDVTLSVGLCGVRPHMPRVLELIREGRCDPMIVTPTTFAWEDAPDALLSPIAKAVLVRPRITTSLN